MIELNHPIPQMTQNNRVSISVASIVFQCEGSLAHFPWDLTHFSVVGRFRLTANEKVTTQMWSNKTFLTSLWQCSTQHNLMSCQCVVASLLSSSFWLSSHCSHRATVITRSSLTSERNLTLCSRSHRSVTKKTRTVSAFGRCCGLRTKAFRRTCGRYQPEATCKTARGTVFYSLTAEDGRVWAGFK